MRLGVVHITLEALGRGHVFNVDRVTTLHSPPPIGSAYSYVTNVWLQHSQTRDYICIFILLKPTQKLNLKALIYKK
jgi:hypothetical protein